MTILLFTVFYILLPWFILGYITTATIFFIFKLDESKSPDLGSSLPVINANNYKNMKDLNIDLFNDLFSLPVWAFWPLTVITLFAVMSIRLIVHLINKLNFKLPGYVEEKK